LGEGASAPGLGYRLGDARASVAFAEKIPEAREFRRGHVLAERLGGRLGIVETDGDPPPPDACGDRSGVDRLLAPPDGGVLLRRLSGETIRIASCGIIPQNIR
jgi:hypothetical protein